MSLPHVVGVTTKKVALFDHLVICVRVKNNGHKEWSQMQLPSFLSVHEQPNMKNNSTSHADKSVLATYSVMQEMGKGVWKPMQVENTPVLVCVLHHDYQIDSLKPPKNFIKPTKTYGVN